MNEEKHKDLIAVLSESLPYPASEDDAPLPASLAERLEKTNPTQSSATLWQSCCRWFRTAQFAYVTSAAIVVLTLVLVFRPSTTPEPTEYGLRGSNSVNVEPTKVIIYRPSGSVWEEFQQLADSSQFTIVDTEEELEQLLLGTSSFVDVVNFETSSILRHSGKSLIPEQEDSLPQTGIDLLAFVEERSLE